MDSPNKIIVAGIGTGVGKTIVSAILTKMLQGDYWKPVQCGDQDTVAVTQWLDPSSHTVHPSHYTLKEFVSPHHAARLEDFFIQPEKIIPPQTKRPLIIEGVGGILVPLTLDTLTIDLFSSWNARWVVVSNHYVGSINHTLLTLEALKQRKISVAGIIFNGVPNPDSEAAILTQSDLPVIGRLFPEKNIDSTIIQRYAKKWHSNLSLLQQ